MLAICYKVVCDLSRVSDQGLDWGGKLIQVYQKVTVTTWRDFCYKFGFLYKNSVDYSRLDIACFA